MRTDGALPVIDLQSGKKASAQDVPVAVARAAAGRMYQPGGSGVVSSDDTTMPLPTYSLAEQRPMSLIVGLLFVSLAMLLDLVIQAWRDPGMIGQHYGLLIGGSLGLQAVIIWMAFRVYQGGAQARTILLILCAISLLPIGITEGGMAWRTIVLACYVFALLALSSPESRRWVRSMSVAKRHS